jgi:adenine-specific DNA-methyltransferase
LIIQLYHTDTVPVELPPFAVERLTETGTLLSVAVGLLGHTRLTQQEKTAIRGVTACTDRVLIRDAGAAIRSGSDPLGNAYCRLKSPLERRDKGQTFTPGHVVQGMLAWAKRQRKPIARLVDPGAGTGRYTVAGLRAFPTAQAIAVEFDPLMAVLLRANLAAAGLSSRCEVVVADYRALEPAPIKGCTLFLGNPPYVRHHDISAQWKGWYSATLKRFGHQGSQLAGLHLHFFLKTLALASKGDLGCFITAAEWLDVNYGKALRQLLTDGLGGKDVYIVKPELKVFEDVLVSAAVTCFAPGANRSQLAFSHICTASELKKLAPGNAVEVEAARAAPRWSIFIRGRSERPAGYVELGEFFKVSRGQVTGSNRVWVAGDKTPAVPKRFLVPAITDSADITNAAAHGIVDLTRLKSVISLPGDLSLLAPSEERAVRRFLAWARKCGAHETYIAKHRNPWWSISFKREPAPIVMTYMGRRPPVFVLNRAGAQLINVAHGLYPRRPISEDFMARLVRWLNENVTRENGRVYAGGLTKFEPSEAMRILVPEAIDHPIQVRVITQNMGI